MLNWNKIRVPVNDPPGAVLAAVDVRRSHRVVGRNAINNGVAVLQPNGVGEATAGTGRDNLELEPGGAGEPGGLLAELGLEIGPAHSGDVRTEQGGGVRVRPQSDACCHVALVQGNRHVPLLRQDLGKEGLGLRSHGLSLAQHGASPARGQRNAGLFSRKIRVTMHNPPSAVFTTIDVGHPQVVFPRCAIDSGGGVLVADRVSEVRASTGCDDLKIERIRVREPRGDVVEHGLKLCPAATAEARTEERERIVLRPQRETRAGVAIVDCAVRGSLLRNHFGEENIGLSRHDQLHYSETVLNTVRMHPMGAKIKRPYDSTRRQQQAAETRRSIIAAANELFISQGYGQTTVKQVAERAGVAVETVYAAFRTKAALLRHVWYVDFRGDEAEVTLYDRAEMQAILAEPDLRARIRRHAAFVTASNRRIAPLLEALTGAAASEPDAVAMLTEWADRRLDVATRYAHAAAATGQLGVAEEECRDVLFATMDGTLWSRFVGQRGWTDERFADWLAAMWISMLVRE